jgi:hypothetical protein
VELQDNIGHTGKKDDKTTSASYHIRVSQKQDSVDSKEDNHRTSMYHTGEYWFEFG